MNWIKKFFLQNNNLHVLRRLFGCILLVAGLLSAAACYFVLFFTQTPASGAVPLSYNPEPAKTDFNITVFGDWMQAAGPLDAIAQKAQDNKSVFAVCLGDFVKHSKLPLMKLAADAFKEKFRIPVYATPGNHDVYNEEDASAFGSVWGNVNNCFAYGDTLFIFLESARKYITEKQIEFLKTVFKYERPKYRRCVIFSHVPPKTNPEFDTPKYRLSEKSAADLQIIFDQNNVDLMVCGHVHHEMQLSFGKTKLLVIPPSGQGSRNKANPQFGCLQIHFAADGSIRHNFIYVKKSAQRNKANEFIYYRLNQYSAFFCIALFMIISGVILISFRTKHPDLSSHC